MNDFILFPLPLCRTQDIKEKPKASALDNRVSHVLDHMPVMPDNVRALVMERMSLIEAAVQEEMMDKGSLVVLTPERFSSEDRTHLALVEQVRMVLAKAGLLR